MSSPCSSGWEAWLATAWNPLLKEPIPREITSYVTPYNVAARPIDARHLPFAIVKNTQMIPALLQNFRDYCESPFAHQDFTGDHTIFKEIEFEKGKIERLRAGDDESRLAYNLPWIVVDLLRLLGQQRVNYAPGHSIESIGVQVSGEWYKRADDDGNDYNYPKLSATILCLFHWLSISVKDDAFYGETEYVDLEEIQVDAMVDTLLNNINQMADDRHIFDHINSPYVHTESSLVIRVRFGKCIGFYFS
jgi:hypothetical protein